MCGFHTQEGKRETKRDRRENAQREGGGRNIDRVKEIRSREEKAAAVVSMNEFDD